MTESITCRICGGATTVWQKGTANGPDYFTATGDYDIAGGDYRQRLPIYRCDQCGHGATEHGVSTSVLDAWYRRHALDTVFLNDEAGRRRTADQVLTRIEKLSDGRGRVLDVGAGPGLFVAAARARGWSAEGVEPSEASRAWAARERGIELKAGGVAVLAHLPVASYDVVTFFDVIEHVIDPAAALREINRVLVPGGLLVLTTPKFDSLMVRFLRTHWYSIFPAHLHYFTRRSLQAVLTSAGFQAVIWRQHIWRTSLGYVLWRLRGWLRPASHQKSVPTGGIWALIIPVSNGDEFEVYARKT